MITVTLIASFVIPLTFIDTLTNFFQLSLKFYFNFKTNKTRSKDIIFICMVYIHSYLFRCLPMFGEDLESQ